MTDPAMAPRAAYMPRKQAILLGIGDARLEIPEGDAEAFSRLVRSWPAQPGRSVEFSIAPFGPGNSIKVSAENAEAVGNAIAGAIEARDLARNITAGARNG